MSTFQVATEALASASAVVARTDLDVGGGRSSLSASSGALDGTPAAAEFAMFVGAADGAVQSLHASADALGRSLNAAAEAYNVADATAAGSLEVRR
jgi:hypothetical protein